jgi:hypothetical protein
MAGELQPLDQQFAIVDPTGRPTLYFIQWAQQRQIDLGTAITLDVLQQYLEDNHLSNVQEILDQISTTRGSVLYRGAAAWAALAPGAAGQFLQTAGPGADPLWAAAGGGGGGSTPTIRSQNIASSSWSSVNIPFPAGTIAGDIVVIHWENGFAVSTCPTGWTPFWISNNGGTWTNQGCAAKIMTAGDIATGFVTVTAGGAFNGTYGAITLVGTTVATFDKFEHYDSPGSSSIASAAVTGMGGVSTTDLIIGFAATRGAMNLTVSANLTILANINAASASGIVFKASAAALGKLGMNELITAPVGNNGLVWSTAAFKGP